MLNDCNYQNEPVMPAEFSIQINSSHSEHRKPFSFSRLGRKLAERKQNLVAFWSLMIIAVCALCTAGFFLSPLWTKLLQLAGCLALGSIYRSTLEGSLAILSRAEKWVYSLFTANGVFIAFGAVYFFTASINLLSCAANACAFLLPFAVNDLWSLFKTINGTSPFAYWHYTPKLAHEPVSEFLTSMPVKIKVQIDQHGRVEHTLAFRAPVRMSLGTVFYHAVQGQDQNGIAGVEFTDATGAPYGWAFFTRRLGWPKFFNPEATLIENGVKPHSVVIARQIIATGETSAQHRKKQNA